jgi:hypothetical protein
MKGRKVRFVRLVLALSRIRSRSVYAVGVRHQSVNSLKSVDQSGLQKHLLDIWLRLCREIRVLGIGSRLAGLRHEGLHWGHRQGRWLGSFNTCGR